MLFKNPQMLWFLWILVIPILIHLLRLRRFIKTPFTNVRILQQIVIKSNRGNQLKKWLILITRIGLFSALVLAFARPFIPDKEVAKPKSIAIFLDNSFSMQAASGSVNLLESAIQDLIQGLPQDFEFALLTNDDQFGIQTLADHQKTLLSLGFTPERSNFESLTLRLESVLPDNNALRELWIISDFQELNPKFDALKKTEIHAIPLKPKVDSNISLDTLFIGDKKNDQIELLVNISFTDSNQVVPVSLFNGDSLLAKSFPEITGKHTGKAIFNVSSTNEINGSIRLADRGLTYDNSLYFTHGKPTKIKVYIVGNGNVDTFQRLFTEDEFIIEYSQAEDIDLVQLQSHQLIILNELTEIPDSWVRPIQAYIESGNSILVIPSVIAKTVSYNRLLEQISDVQFGNLTSSMEKITEINYAHELFQGVFDGNTTNFDYPNALQYFELKSASSGILNFQNGLPFLIGGNNVYILATGLEPENSSFNRSPLIVPTFYNIAKASLPFPELYFSIGKPAIYDLNFAMQGDGIISLMNSNYDFIPQQQQYPEKIRLIFEKEPKTAGNFDIMSGKQKIGTVSFNYTRNESSVDLPTIEFNTLIQTYEQLEDLLKKNRNKVSNHELWKWFVIFALFFMTAELILQKTLK